MAVKVLPQTVADAFVKQYYAILNRCPEKAHKFYQELSILGWQGPDGVMTSITSLSGISDTIMSSAYKNCTVEIKSRDAQESLHGGIIIIVTGSLTGKDNVKKEFCQTFFLAKQEKGYYVLNDILRLINVANAPANNDGIENQPVPSLFYSRMYFVFSDTSTFLYTNAVVEDEKNKEAFDPSVSEDTVAEGAETMSSIASGENVHSSFALASTENVPWTVVTTSNKKGRSAAKKSKKKSRSSVAPEVKKMVQSSVPVVSNEEVRSIVPLASIETVPSVVEPYLTGNVPEIVVPALTKIVPAVVATTSTEREPSNGARASDEKAHSAIVWASDEQAPSAVAPDSNVPPVAAAASTVTNKITYASIVAKQIVAASPRTIRVVINVNKQRAPSPTAKVSTPASKDARNFDSYAEVTGIYIGGLPKNITKQGLIDVIKKYGPVRRKPDTVQIRRHGAHRVKFGETEAYIAYKRSSGYRGNEAGGRSPTNNRTNSNKGQSRHRRRGS
ncbi:Nuclear transport factor 2 [Handroanthus impetiginosus]|uniref:Nuclear transport factor 2 n=1 Tax=Handroanthus impetiginosus TaxID=429701 RepID=A0A2G9HGS7_9LAMI|nr:Nuclear transport factor 2 [Handroanthus impetiginosus]